MAPFASSLRLNVNSILRHMRLQHLIPVCISSFAPAGSPGSTAAAQRDGSLSPTRHLPTLPALCTCCPLSLSVNTSAPGEDFSAGSFVHHALTEPLGGFQSCLSHQAKNFNSPLYSQHPTWCLKCS